MKKTGSILSLLLVAFFSLSVFVSNAQLEFPEDKVSWKFSVEQNGDEATIIGTITMVPHWHIYAVHVPEGSFVIPTDMKLNSSTSFKLLGKITEPKPIHEHDEATDEDLYYHSNTITIRQKIKILSDKDFTIKGVFSFQTCDDSHCLPPHDAEFSVKVKGVKQDELSSNDDQPEAQFAERNGDEARDKEGNRFVKVNNQWYKVPEGNSNGFYKKYLILGGKHEE